MFEHFEQVFEQLPNNDKLFEQCAKIATAHHIDIVYSNSHIVQSDTLTKVGHRICTNACKGGSSRRRPTATYMVQPRRHRWVRPSVVKM